MNFLLTGSSGFIGTRLLNAINDNLVLLSRNNNTSFPTIICDFEKDEIPPDTFLSIDVVIHLAGISHDLGDASKIEKLYRKVNVDASVKLAALAAKNNVKRFIFISSVKAGGKPITGRCRLEDEQDSPDGIYGITKREAEVAILEIGKKSKMNVVVIRPSLVYGPNVKGNLNLMLKGIKSGWFPPLPETYNRRSMIHVDDLVRAIMLVSKDQRSNGKILIATDGNLYSSREIYETMCVLVNKSIPNWHVPKFMFNLLKFMSNRLKYKVDKLLGDECYESKGLGDLGFKPNKTLSEMNETSF